MEADILLIILVASMHSCQGLGFHHYRIPQNSKSPRLISRLDRATNEFSPLWRKYRYWGKRKRSDLDPSTLNTDRRGKRFLHYSPFINEYKSPSNYKLQTKPIQSRYISIRTPSNNKPIIKSQNKPFGRKIHRFHRNRSPDIIKSFQDLGIIRPTLKELSEISRNPRNRNTIMIPDEIRTLENNDKELTTVNNQDDTELQPFGDNFNIGENDNVGFAQTFKSNRYQYSDTLENPGYFFTKSSIRPSINPFLRTYDTDRSEFLYPFEDLSKKGVFFSSPNVFDIPSNSWITPSKKFPDLSDSTTTATHHINLNDLHDEIVSKESNGMFKIPMYDGMAKDKSDNGKDISSILDDPNWDGTFGDWEPAKKVDISQVQPGFYQFDGPGEFVTEQSGCKGIENRHCESDSECLCYGLYYCIKNQCSTQTADSDRNEDSGSLSFEDLMNPNR